MAKKKGTKKRGKTADVTARPIAEATRDAKKQAQAVRKLLPREATEDRAKLDLFIERLDTVRASVRKACEAIAPSGNPMFETFDLK
jgi:hypothetical protein